MIARHFFNNTAFGLVASLFFCQIAIAQGPPGYYNGTGDLYGQALQQALHNIIKDHQPRTYADLWGDFMSTDRKSNNKVWDMYSDKPGGTPAYEFTFSIDQCGNYNSEGDCYNREHSFPASWFNDGYPMYSDLFQIIPTDGYVNNRRSNFPFGEVNQSDWTSTNGTKLGNSATPGYNGTVFEPINEYKGDLARNILYMAVRYYGEDGSWPGSDMTDGAEPRTWARKMLLDWHASDPVSSKEVQRNNAVYVLQQNRNPFIDHPEFAEQIWGENAGINKQDLTFGIALYPNPAREQMTILYETNSSLSMNLSLTITDISGQTVMTTEMTENPYIVNFSSSIKSGCYLVLISSEQLPVYRSILIKL
jgi:endonuclease I